MKVWFFFACLLYETARLKKNSLFLATLQQDYVNQKKGFVVHIWPVNRGLLMQDL